MPSTASYLYHNETVTKFSAERPRVGLIVYVPARVQGQPYYNARYSLITVP